MKHSLSLLFVFALFLLSSFEQHSINTQQTTFGYKAGEFLKYRFHYGSMNAGFATLTVYDAKYNNEPHHYIKGYGYSTGVVSSFFKVEDHYESYINKATGIPSKSVRNINEGGYTKNQVTYFNHAKNSATVSDKKNGTNKSYKVHAKIQDMLSSLYYLRNQDFSKKKVGDSVDMDIFLDEEIYPFKVKITAKGVVKETKFGKIKCIALKPLVQAGRIFKEKESLTIYVSEDSNLVPIQVKADILVGSLKADLEEYKNLVEPLKFYK
ncbi:MAG: DUF3108 domain-containing protein [Flavobacteriaceae bacterium]|nr:MAG: DUF3108 domain-containing protein [Flavobacteriaceae bacterium]